MEYKDNCEDKEIFLYDQILYSARKSFDEYYYSFCSISIFLIGAFVLYISTKVSRGIFALIDTFIIYKLLQMLYEFKKNKKRDNLEIQYQMKFLNAAYKFSIVFILEAITRHFLILDIVITKYLIIMAIVYGVGILLYLGLKFYMKKKYLAEILTGNYDRIIRWKALKHKLFVILSFFMVIMLVISNMMNILSGVSLLILMTLIYLIFLIVAIEIKCDLEIEEEFLLKKTYLSALEDMDNSVDLNNDWGLNQDDTIDIKVSNNAEFSVDDK